MVPFAGIEPAACCLQGSCSDQHELKRHEKKHGANCIVLKMGKQKPRCVCIVV
jgi:hypothetical protein